MGAKEEPGSNECDRRCDERVAKGTVTCSAAAADERCDRDEGLGRDAAHQCGPAVRPIEGRAVEHRDDRERRGGQ